VTHIEIDEDRCVGHGRCYALAPDVFDADDVGHGTVLTDKVAGVLESQAVDAERNCPEGAITLSP
jgi:ferredoxin